MLNSIWIFKPNDAEIEYFKVSHRLEMLKAYIIDTYEDANTKVTFRKTADLVWVYFNDDEWGLISEIEVIK